MANLKYDDIYKKGATMLVENPDGTLSRFTPEEKHKYDLDRMREAHYLTELVDPEAITERDIDEALKQAHMKRAEITPKPQNGLPEFSEQSAMELNGHHSAAIMFTPVFFDDIDQQTINGFGGILRIPVVPGSLTISQSAPHNEENALMFGGVLERNNGTLRTFTIESFIPRSYILPHYEGGIYVDNWGGRAVYGNQQLQGTSPNFIQSNWIDFIQFIIKRRMVLDFEMVLEPVSRHRQEHFYVCISKFDYTFNPHDDINYTLELIEWREPQVHITEEIVSGLGDNPPIKQKPPVKRDGDIWIVLHDHNWHSAEWVGDLVSGKTEAISHAYKMTAESLTKYALSRIEHSVIDNVRWAKKIQDVLNTMNNNVYKIKAKFPIPLSSWDKMERPITEKISTTHRTREQLNSPAEGLQAIVRSLKDGIGYIRGFVQLHIDKMINDLPKDKPPVLKFYDGGDLVGVDSTKGNLKDHGEGVYMKDRQASWVKYGDKVPSSEYDFAEGDFVESELGYSPASYISKLPNIPASRITNTVTDGSGKIPYDDLVKRDADLDIIQSGLKCRVVVNDLKIDPTILTSVYPGYVDMTFDWTVTIFLFRENITHHEGRRVTTVGSKYYKGQTINVYKEAVRKPTKQELNWDKTRSKWNQSLGRNA